MKTFNGGLFTDFDVMPLATPAAASAPERLSVTRQPVAAYRVRRGGPEVTLRRSTETSE
jgi:hypothetical protein